MAKYWITAYPYATQEGSIEVPIEELEAEGKDAYDYIKEHFDEIEFGEVQLDYAGTDFEYEPE